MRAAARVAVTVRCVRGIDARGLHVTNLAALARSLERVAVPEAVCLVDGFSVPSCAVDPPRRDRRRRNERGDRRRLGGRQGDQGPIHVQRRFVLSAVRFAGNVGYSTPEHRAAIIEHGPSALHRRSFQSIAYSQLELS